MVVESFFYKCMVVILIKGSNCEVCDYGKFKSYYKYNNILGFYC